MPKTSKRIFDYAEIRLLGAICNSPSWKSPFTSRDVVFLGGVVDVDVVTFGEIAPYLENCTWERITSCANTRKWEFSRKFEIPQNLSILRR